MYKIGEFSKKIGISVRTLRDWDKKNILKPAKITKGGVRFYSESQLNSYLGIIDETVQKKNYIYARVSNQNQKDDLKNQIEFLKTFCNAQGIIIEDLYDIGSGLNYKRKNWNKLLQEVMKGNVNKIYITYKDRFVRFGFEMLEYLCEINNVEIEIVDNTSYSKEQELTDDLIQIITVFANRLYGQRLKKTKKLIDEVKNNDKNSENSP